MKYPPVAPFNPHGSTCKGHGMSFLDCTYETKEERDLMVQILNNYIVNETNPTTTS